MLSGILTDLDNPTAPGGANKITMATSAFKTWMKAMRFREGISNPKQEVFFLKEMSKLKSGHHEYVPNWHITAMLVHRQGGDVRNWHFKVEMGKAAAHYWHYVIYEHHGDFIWVGDPNPLLPATNQGGGGAGANQQLLTANYNETESSARQHGLDATVGKQTQQKMMKKLKSMTTSGVLNHAGDRID